MVDEHSELQKTTATLPHPVEGDNLMAQDQHAVIVMGASSGGVEALKTIVAGLPADLPAAILAVLHIPPDSPMLLADILNYVSVLPCQYAEDQQPIRRGHIYLAPPDRHLLVEPGRLRLVRGPRENRARPAIDPLFRSAAAAYSTRSVGVVLTGNLNDGAAGLSALKQAGGVAVVQDPRDILYPSMPQHALAAVEADYVVPLAEIASVLSHIVKQPVATGSEPGRIVAVGVDEEEKLLMAQEEQRVGTPSRPSGAPSPFVCPECGGVLNEVEESPILRFRCQVGHAYTAEVLHAEQIQALEQALWVALRTLEEKLELQRRMAQQATQQRQPMLAARWQQDVAEVEQQLQLLRQVLGLSTD